MTERTYAPDEVPADTVEGQEAYATGFLHARCAAGKFSESPDYLRGYAAGKAWPGPGWPEWASKVKVRLKAEEE